MVILFRPCPVLTLKERQQPFRSNIKIQAVLFITSSGLSLLPKVHSKLVCFVPEPENFNCFCLSKNWINTPISLPVHYLIKQMKMARSPTLIGYSTCNWLLNAQENVKKGLYLKRIRTNRLHATTSGKPKTAEHCYSCGALQNAPLKHHWCSRKVVWKLDWTD